MPRIRELVGSTLACLVTASGHLAAQPTVVSSIQFADRGPTFYTASTSGGSIAVNVGTIAILQHQIAIDLSDDPLSLALDAVSRAAHVAILYNAVDIPRDRRVTLEAKRITLAGALNVILVDAGVDVHVLDQETIALARRGATVPNTFTHRQSTATVLGRVTDLAKHIALRDVTVNAVGSKHHATTDQDGSYLIADLPPGKYTFVARRLGYAPASKTVTLSADQVDTLDFQLSETAALLEKVVTTVTGDRRLVEMGNLVETIPADSVVRTAPVTSLSDVVSGRVAGVQVFTAGGFSGGSPDINIRGQNSFTVTNLPLLYIDGVRTNNSTLGNSGLGQAQGLVSGRFNDINPADIESIEVVKGPSAATLYGTDAANGVILIKTKRGGGARRWSIFGETGVVNVDRSAFPYNYTAWGHSTDGTNTPMKCTVITVAEKTCAEDSVTRFSALRDLATSPIAAGYRDQLGAQVNGGGSFRYFASGGYEAETAPLKMPAPDRRILDSLNGSAGVSSEQLRPNAYDRYSGRANVVTPLGGTADLSLSLSIEQQQSRIPFSEGIWSGAELAPATPSINDGWSYYRPANVWVARNDESADHWAGGATSTWRPTGWLSARATGGIDFSSDFYDELWPADETLLFSSERTNARTNTTLYTADVGVTASVPFAGLFSSSASVGGQYNRTLLGRTVAEAQNLLPGFTTVSGGTTAAAESNVETIVAGAYVEEVIGLKDQFFVTGALRADQGSSFGGINRHPIVYPKGSVSWRLSDAPFFPRSQWLTSVRLRTAYGETGVQPPPTASLQTLAVGPTYADGGVETGASLQTVANPDLRPERQREFEAGTDAELASGRVRLEVTYYNKQSDGALVSLPIQPSLGVLSGTELFNVGSVRNRGVEGLLTVDAIAAASTRLTLGLNGSLNQNRLLSISQQVASLTNSINGGFLRVGYPIYNYFAQPILSWSDANHNGVIEPSEVQVGATPAYRGPAYPTTHRNSVRLPRWLSNV
jgi:TonB-dependent SusC/RagA subfamily outer membrane receptor